MSTTLIVWVALVGTLAILSLTRAAYGFSLYLLTFFLFPAFWWWGRPMPNLRWNLLAAIVFLVAVLLQKSRTPLEPAPSPDTTRITNLAVAIAVNATLVHLVLAPSWEVSLDNYVKVLKFVLLVFMMTAAVRTPGDLRLVLWSIILGASYIGYEVTFQDRGMIRAGRLEGVGAAGVNDSNGLASLMSTILPLAGALFFMGGWREKIVIALAGPMILNVVLLCSSRGALLALILGAFAFLLNATSGVRKQALFGLALAGLAAYVMLGNPKILDRFSTTFTSAEERDSSASQRLVYWSAGVRMIIDHPLGAGGDGFKNAYSAQYLDTGGSDVWARSIHNGILNEACEWGLQGLLLRMLFLGSAVLLARKTLRQLAARGNTGEATLGCCLIASVVVFLVTSCFGDYMDDEWGYWLPALVVIYARVYAVAAVPALAHRPAAAPARGVRMPGHAATERA